MPERIASAAVAASVILVLSTATVTAQERSPAEGPRTVRELFSRIFGRDEARQQAQAPLVAAPAAEPAPARRAAAPRRQAAPEAPSLPRPRVAPFAEVAARAAEEMPAALAVAEGFRRNTDPAARRVDGAFAALETLAGPLERVGTPGALLAYGAAPDPAEVATAPAAPERAVRPAKGEVESLVDRHAREKGVPVDLARGLVFVLSTNNPRATGASGEIGLMQISPTTARGMGYSGSVEALYDPDTNLHWGMKYLADAQSRGDGTTCETLLRYSAGVYATTMTDGARRFCAKVKTAMEARR